MDDFFALPPFKPAEAWVQLKRQLRDLRGLQERGDRFDWQGQTVLQAEVQASQITVRLARRPARTPDWTEHRLAAAADVRRFLDEVRKRLATWTDE